jgi:four helix bundle protein
MFEAKEMAKQIVIEIRPMLVEIKKRDADLFDQAYRAAKSMALNVAEGGKRTGKDRNYHFSVSAGSADELKTALEIAVAFGLIAEASLTPALALLDRELAMLWRLRHPKRAP